jgi:NADPH:quinone reductase-like Zn-dependent oxidoreductase
MKAVLVVKYGDAVEGVELREVSEPDAPKPGEVLIGVEFSPINFNDLMGYRGDQCQHRDSQNAELHSNGECGAAHTRDPDYAAVS